MLTKLFGTAILTTVLSLGVAEANTIAASLFPPLVSPGGSLILIDLSGPTASQATLNRSGYSISFTGVSSDQGLVQGTLGGLHEVPFAGVAGASPEYLTTFGAPMTADIGASGNYLSTGFGTITISFLAPQRSFGLLWGSIDDGNMLHFNDASGFGVTGATARAAAAGLGGNAFLGSSGSAYVMIETDTPFTTVTATSSMISFEFQPVLAAETTSNPEPAGFALMAGGILLLFAYRRRNAKRAA